MPGGKGKAGKDSGKAKSKVSNSNCNVMNIKYTFKINIEEIFRKSFREVQGPVCNSPLDVFTVFSRSEQRVMDVLVRRQLFILRQYWNTSRLKYWNWQGMRRKI
jgi:hypothetical protein